MKWRGVGAVLVGLLLIVPWVLLFREMMPRAQPAREEWEAHVSPVLSPEERLSRVTYWRSCTRSEECEAPLGCLSHPRLKKHFCTDSHCVTDAQCQEGSTCQVVRTAGDGPWIRLCVPSGERKQGEACRFMSRERAHACEPGLVCAAARCGRPFRKDEPLDCPEGFSCTDTAFSPPICLSTCEERGCSEGR